MRVQSLRRRSGLLLVVGAILACAAEPREESADEAARPSATSGPGERRITVLDPPAAEGAFAPNLTIASGSLLASWLERTDVGGQPGHRLLVSRRGEAGWSPPVVVAEGNDFFANWADFPAVVEAGDGSLLAHWLAKTGEETYAYSIFVARSRDGGASWSPLGRLNEDDTPTEHGFVSWLAEDDGARAFWLDGRAMAEGGTMTLRTARVGEEIGPAEVLDERVCECCATGAARATDGPVVVYRDRSDEEIRDISFVRYADGWTSPAAVAEDGWKIPGCPVNGPRVAAEGERVAVAWFTVADETPRVKVALSADGGARFESPLVLDRDQPFGRVDVVLGDDGNAWVVWLAKSGGRGTVILGRVDGDGLAEEPIAVAATDGGRRSGFPRLARIGERIYVAWVEVDAETPSRVRVAEVTVDALR